MVREHMQKECWTIWEFVTCLMELCRLMRREIRTSHIHTVLELQWRWLVSLLMKMNMQQMRITILTIATIVVVVVRKYILWMTIERIFEQRYKWDGRAYGSMNMHKRHIRMSMNNKNWYRARVFMIWFTRVQNCFMIINECIRWRYPPCASECIHLWRRKTGVAIYSRIHEVRVYYSWETNGVCLVINLVTMSRVFSGWSMGDKWPALFTTTCVNGPLVLV